MRDVIEMMAQRGLGRGEIAETLTEAGWTAAEVERELGLWVWTRHGPVPKPDRRARDIVMGLSGLTLLTFVSLNAVALAFEMVDHLVADPSLPEAYSYWRSGMYWPAANLLVLSPLLAIFLRRFGQIPGWSRVAAGMFVGVVLTCDAITVLHGLLSGDAGLRFILKAVIVAVVASLAAYAVRADRET